MINEPRLIDDSTTHQGCVRTANEDSMASLSRERVWAVADGMGGHKNGQYASRKVIEAIESASIPEDMQGACSAVANAIVAASDALFAETQSNGETMGSTIVSLIIRDRQFAVLWVGDSRAYLHRDGNLRQLTRDHTQVQDMVDRGLLDAAAAEHHPMGHVLARAVGAQSDLIIDSVSDKAEIGDLFLLCSDGLHGVLSDDEITHIIENPSRQTAEQLVQACLERGAPDNVTVSIIQLFEPTTLTFAQKQEAM